MKFHKSLTLMVLIIASFCANAQKLDSLKVHYTIYYDWNKVYATGEQMEKLDKVGKWLQSNDTNVVLIGSSDTNYNKEGGMRVALSRAKSVAQWLETKYGISPSRITIKNGGIDNTSPSNKARRVDVAEMVTIIAAPKPEPTPEQKPMEDMTVSEKVAEITQPEEEVTSDIKDAKKSQFSVRTNLLRLATLTADLGIEWRINQNWGILAHGTYTSWSWDDKNRSYALWQVSPEVRYYFGNNNRWYGGLAYQVGEFDYKLGTNGYQTTDLYHTASIVAGYNLPLNNCLSLDFGIGAGYTSAPYDKYTIQEAVRVRSSKGTKNYWGVNQASVTLQIKIN